MRKKNKSDEYTEIAIGRFCVVVTNRPFNMFESLWVIIVTVFIAYFMEILGVTKWTCWVFAVIGSLIAIGRSIKLRVKE